MWSDQLVRGHGEDIVASGGRVKVVPKEKGVRINEGDALRTGGDICEREFGGGRDDLVEEIGRASCRERVLMPV